ncbi:hypothetical protein ABZ454_24070 [Streptomyces sp. NPDC005803]|uniref:hypothetical protein n=1 Tax=Streptomyces sp. NPDC005803 TaxID=3154297 RepID=UPI0033FFD37C
MNVHVRDLTASERHRRRDDLPLRANRPGNRQVPSLTHDPWGASAPPEESASAAL